MRKKEKPAPVLDEKGRPPLKLDYPQTFKVGFAFAIIMLFWTAYDFVVPLLLEHAYGLPSWARGLIMGLDNLLSLFMLPLFGKLSDNAKGKLVKKWGRRTPFIVIGTVCAVVLMVFVPVATLKQQAKAQDLTASIEAKLNDDTFMQPLLEDWYDNAVAGKEGSANYCDLTYLNNNKVTRDQFVSLRYDSKMTSKKAVLNMLGATTYYYDGEVVEDLSATSPTGKTYQEIVDSNAAYKKYVAAGMNNYISNEVHENLTKTDAGIKSLVVYMVILLLVLIAMATFRSPAVALMPDVTPKPLRSQANAIINLCGGIGGAIAFLIYTIVLFGQRLENYVIISARLRQVCSCSLQDSSPLSTSVRWLQNAKKSAKNTKSTTLPTAKIPRQKNLRKNLLPKATPNTISTANPTEKCKNLSTALQKRKSHPKRLSLPSKLLKTRRKNVNLSKSFGQERVISKRKTQIVSPHLGVNLHVVYGLQCRIVQPFNLHHKIPQPFCGHRVDYLRCFNGHKRNRIYPRRIYGCKIGRRKSIMIGFGMAVVSFVLICFSVRPSDKAAVPAVLFALFYLIAGFGLIIANVNTFPMVTELSTAETVGQYTGYYYVATMSAQAITPAIGGAIMDAGGNQYLFLYSAVCIVIAIVLMLFVKHGDSKQITKGRKLTKEEKKQIRLDALDAD